MPKTGSATLSTTVTETWNIWLKINARSNKSDDGTNRLFAPYVKANTEGLRIMTKWRQLIILTSLSKAMTSEPTIPGRRGARAGSGEGPALSRHWPSSSAWQSSLPMPRNSLHSAHPQNQCCGSSISSEPGSRALMTQSWRKKIQLKNPFLFFWSKIALFSSKASIKDVQATEAFSPQQRTSSTN